MSGNSSIEWTDATWNPVRGCSRVSPGCLNCYAEKVAARFSDEGGPFHLFASRTPKPHWTGKVAMAESKLMEPLKWRKPQRVFVNSMSDLFHEDLPDEAIDRVFAVMALCPQHTFQVLTKRPERMREYFADVGFRQEMIGIVAEAISGTDRFRRSSDEETGTADDILPRWTIPLPNVWLGVSVEDQQRADERIPVLLQTPAAIRFVSYEPALEKVGFANLFPSAHGMRNDKFWIIVGGESGPGARPFNTSWARSVVGQCKDAGVACFVKQLGAHVIQNGERRKKADKKGGDMDEWEHDLRVREFPK